MPRRFTQHPTAPRGLADTDAAPELELSSAGPLTSDERAEAEQRGRRLCSELANTLGQLPDDCRTIRGMAAYLNLNANICQRAVAAAQLHQQPLEAISRAPGVSGLRSLVAALKARKVSRRHVESLDTSVEQFAAFIRECGGSLAHVQRRIAATSNEELHQQIDADERAEEQTRKRMFQSTAAWFGARIRTQAVTSVVRIKPGHPDSLQSGVLNAYLGYRTRASAAPLLMTFRTRFDEPTPPEPPADDPPQEEVQAVLLPEFSSMPPPIITTRTKDDRSIQQIIDTAVASSRPVDTVTMARFPDSQHPDLHEAPSFSSYILITHPTQELVFDVWMDRPLAAASIPSAQIGFAGKSLREGQCLPWYHRLPGTANIELLSPETIKPVDSWPHHAAATRRLFDMLDWPINSFVGYRLRLTYPVWHTAAVIQFDFPKPQA